LFKQKYAQKVSDDDSENIEVTSAGIAATTGMPASAETKRVLEEEGIQVDRHRSRPITRHLVEDADLVVVMTASQRDVLIRQFPEITHKIRLLKDDLRGSLFSSNPPEKDKEAALDENSPGEAKDIKDPFGESQEVYRQTLEEIDEHLKKLCV